MCNIFSFISCKCRCIKNALTAPPLKWNQFFRTPWATNVEVPQKKLVTPLLIQNPAWAQVRAAAGGGKEAGAGRGVLLPPQGGRALCQRWLQPERQGSGWKDSGWLLPLALQVPISFMSPLSIFISQKHFFLFLFPIFVVVADFWWIAMATKKPLGGNNSNNKKPQISFVEFYILFPVYWWVVP